MYVPEEYNCFKNQIILSYWSIESIALDISNPILLPSDWDTSSGKIAPKHTYALFSNSSYYEIILQVENLLSSISLKLAYIQHVFLLPCLFDLD